MREEGKAVTLRIYASGTPRDPLHPGNVGCFEFGTREIPAQCRKLHQDPRIYSEFPQFFPKTICAGFKSRDPGAYPCRVAAFVSAKPPEFLLSISYPSESVIAQSLLSCQVIVPSTFLL
jgi:hypothetical protein